jgi:hypothetical protein
MRLCDTRVLTHSLLHLVVPQISEGVQFVLRAFAAFFLHLVVNTCSRRRGIFIQHHAFEFL